MRGPEKYHEKYLMESFTQQKTNQPHLKYQKTKIRTTEVAMKLSKYS